MSRERRLAAQYSRGTYDVVALGPDLVRIDIDTEDGDIVSCVLIINDASTFVRDISRAISDAKRML